MKERNDEICARYLSGESLLDLSTDLGVTVSAIVYRLDKNGISRRAGGPKPAIDGESSTRRFRRIYDAHGDELVQRYRAGETLDEVAAVYGTDRASTRRFLADQGVKIRSRGAMSERQYGSNNPNFQTGAYVNSDGYRRVLVLPDDPMVEMTDSHRYVLEHRLVMARMIGRPLLPDETVHHIDGDRLNNDPSNLQLRRGRHGRGAHFQCNACGSTDVGAVAI